jgi:hypothetical protein
MPPRSARESLDETDQVSGVSEYDDNDNDGMPPLQQTLLVHNVNASNVLKEMLIISGEVPSIHPNSVGLNYDDLQVNYRFVNYHDAIIRARGNSILTYFSFEHFLVEFLKIYGWPNLNFDVLVSAVRDLQDLSCFRSLPQHVVDKYYVRSLLYRHGFVWSRVIYAANGDVATHEISLNYDHWSSDFIDDLITITQMRVVNPDETGFCSWDGSEAHE